MSFVSDLFGMVNVQRIKNGGTARLSVCQITSLIVNMSEARQRLPDHNFNDVYALFKRLRKVKKKRRMDIYGYYDLSSKIILLYNNLAPFTLYSGNSPEDAAVLMKAIEEEYADLSLSDIEAEVFGAPTRARKKWMVIFLILSILFFGSSTFFYSKYIDAKSECASLQKSLSDSQEAVNTLSDQYMDLVQEVSFFEGSSVLVSPRGSKYHRYGCSHINMSTAQVLTFEQAKNKGYTACLTCKPVQKPV